ncbi:hypothetical protein A2704_06830 [Candidatus Kaiserbacteria bacterium RIFCSPHIGHO2_01_FULL_54_36b]|uniref:N-acetyltransferase domain-containing protein n=1 Tax=Candidatus Kaiserbacteria bacterium RIFCSPHIGHO2_01_FULL_54_36b TaxID=1798483 RepID=A0A1F6CKW3_9BACT|nr:MAG: hypothetical protein A2704_06830 [Candidatus Kaiserbacteria bacterium RIFCSPHIGHO2_01_FULL_54_36b]
MSTEKLEPARRNRNENVPDWREGNDYRGAYLDPEETAQLRQFYRDFNQEDIFTNLGIFMKRSGLDKIQSFIESNRGNDMRVLLFDIMYVHAPGDCQWIFEACSKILGKVDALDGFLKENFGVNNLKNVEELVQTQRKKAWDFLRAAHHFADDMYYLHYLAEEKVSNDIELFLKACKILKEEGKLSLENISGGSLEEVAGNHVSSEDALIIREVQAAHYREKYPEDELYSLREGLDASLGSPHSRFYLYKKNGEIVTFTRFDELTDSGNRNRSMASFMTDPKYLGGALGQTMLELALQKELEIGPVYAECDPSLVSFYEKFGFRLLRSYKNDHGVETCDIVLEPEAESLREAA